MLVPAMFRAALHKTLAVRGLAGARDRFALTDAEVFAVLGHQRVALDVVDKLAAVVIG